jgi:hypothetical protein
MFHYNIPKESKTLPLSGGHVGDLTASSCLRGRSTCRIGGRSKWFTGVAKANRIMRQSRWSSTGLAAAAFARDFRRIAARGWLLGAGPAVGQGAAVPGAPRLESRCSGGGRSQAQLRMSVEGSLRGTQGDPGRRYVLRGPRSPRRFPQPCHGASDCDRAAVIAASTAILAIPVGSRQPG